MKKLFAPVLLAALLSGCIVRTNQRRGDGSSPRRMDTSCPPAHHWNGYECVHNGNGRGNGRGRGR